MAVLLRCSLKGTMPGGEIWSVNPVWTISDFETAVTGAQVSAAATAAAAVAVNGNIRSAWTSSVVATSFRVEARTAAGVLQELAEAPLGAGMQGTGVSAHPFQTSWVTSLLTAQVGATGRGRLYWPATGIPVTAGTLRPSTSAATTFVGGVQTYLSGVQTALRTVFSSAGLVVWSRSTGGRYLVNTLRQGDILDTQRRRRDSAAESYSSVAY